MGREGMDGWKTSTTAVRVRHQKGLLTLPDTRFPRKEKRDEKGRKSRRGHLRTVQDDN